MSVKQITQENFNSEVINSTSPVLVDFWATWCGPCKMMAPVVEEIAQEHPEIKVCKIDVDENEALAIKYNVMSIPTFLVFKDGKVTANTVGVRDKAEIIEMINK